MSSFLAARRLPLHPMHHLASSQRVFSSSSKRHGAMQVTCKAGKKAGRKGKGKAPDAPTTTPTDTNAASASGSHAVATTTGNDDDAKIPYGDASGAAMTLTDVMLSVADTDLLNEGCATVMKGQVVGLVGGNGEATLRLGFTRTEATMRLRFTRTLALWKLASKTSCRYSYR